MYSAYEYLIDRVWADVEKFLSPKERKLIDYPKYDKQISDIINSIEALALDIIHDIEDGEKLK